MTEMREHTENSHPSCFQFILNIQSYAEDSQTLEVNTSPPTYLINTVKHSPEVNVTENLSKLRISEQEGSISHLESYNPEIIEHSDLKKSHTSVVELKKQSIWATHFIAEVAEIVMEFLEDADMCGYLNCVSKDWVIKPTERTYSRLCHFIYLNQTERKLLNLDHWISWRNMLVNRPRVRTNGFYWLRTSYWKPPVNDRFWEEKRREFIEVITITIFIFIIIAHMFCYSFLSEQIFQTLEILQ